MRKAATMAFYHLLQVFRDPKGLALMLLMPMILIGILGAALNGLMSGGKIDPFDVLVVDADQAVSLPHPGAAPLRFGQILVEEVLGGDGVREMLRIAERPDREEARAAVMAGEAVAAIYIPPDLTREALAGKAAQIEVIIDPGRRDLAAIVVQIVGSFTDALTSMALANSLLPPGSAIGESAAFPHIEEIPSGVKPVSAMQYYAAAMAIMFMVMGALSRASNILTERQSGTLSRVLTSPTSRATLLAGLIASTVTILFSQFIILLMGTRWLFGVYWGPLLPVLALGLAFTVAAAGCGIAAAGLLKDPKAAEAAVGVVGNLFGALTGTMFPLWLFPDTMKLIARAIPNYWALQGFLDQMAGAGPSVVWAPVSILLLMGIGTGALGSWRLAAK